MSRSSAAATAGETMEPTSLSSIVAEAVSGSQFLTINGYSQTRGLGKFIRSSPFVVGGHTWRILYCPDGRNEGSIPLFLRLDDKTDVPEVKVRSDLILLDYESGKPVPELTRPSEGRVHTFSGDKNNPVSHPGWFIDRRLLEQQTSFLGKWWIWIRGKPQPTFLKNDSFRVRCDITVLKEISTEDATYLMRTNVVVPPSDICNHLGRLLSSGEGADVEFDVAGDTFVAHRCILAARSPVFMAELFGPMKEKTTSFIRVEDMEAGVFKALLHFIYNDALPDIDDGEVVVMAQHLLVAADRYSLHRLKLVCEDALCRSIDTNTVATTLALADQHNCHALKESCFIFLRSRGNMTAAMATDGFQHLTDSCPPLVKELLANVSV